MWREESACRAENQRLRGEKGQGVMRVRQWRERGGGEEEEGVEGEKEERGKMKESRCNCTCALYNCA